MNEQNEFTEAADSAEQYSAADETASPISSDPSAATAIKDETITEIVSAVNENISAVSSADSVSEESADPAEGEDRLERTFAGQLLETEAEHRDSTGTTEVGDIAESAANAETNAVADASAVPEKKKRGRKKKSEVADKADDKPAHDAADRSATDKPAAVEEQPRKRGRKKASANTDLSEPGAAEDLGVAASAVDTAPDADIKQAAADASSVSAAPEKKKRGRKKKSEAADSKPDADNAPVSAPAPVADIPESAAVEQSAAEEAVVPPAKKRGRRKKTGSEPVDSGVDADDAAVAAATEPIELPTHSDRHFREIFLVDFENVSSEGLNGVDQLSADDQVIIFYSSKSDKLSFSMHLVIQHCPAAFDYFGVTVGGKNALDHQLSTYLGYLIGINAADRYTIVSKDNGYRFLTDFWGLKRKVNVLCCGQIASAVRRVRAAAAIASSVEQTAAEQSAEVAAEAVVGQTEAPSHSSRSRSRRRSDNRERREQRERNEAASRDNSLASAAAPVTAPPDAVSVPAPAPVSASVPMSAENAVPTATAESAAYALPDEARKLFDDFGLKADAALLDILSHGDKQDGYLAFINRLGHEKGLALYYKVRKVLWK